MSRLHICNCFFEEEIFKEHPLSLKEWLCFRKPYMQLQFLPLLYASKEDLILVSDLPKDPDPRLRLIDEALFFSGEIEDFGPSFAIEAWAKGQGLFYPSYDKTLLQTINSKIFSFHHSPKLPFSKLLYSQEELQEWIFSFPEPKVLKAPYETAGRGHIFNLNQPLSWKTPLIAEPWVERVLDFSTQWNKAKLLGVTLFENDPKGCYKKTYVQEVDPFILQEHLSVVEPLVKRIQTMGYEGHLGVDAFVYLWKGKKRVHPVVEINARKTMSWVALQLPSKSLSYVRSPFGALPSQLKKIQFPKNIVTGSSSYFPL